MLTEDQLEQQCLQWFRDGGWDAADGPDISPDGTSPERMDYRETILVGRLLGAMQGLNPHIPPTALEEALQSVLKLDHPILEQRNRAFHRLLLDGIPVEYREGDETRHDTARLINFSSAQRNEFLVVDQFAIKGPKHVRRPDLIVCINGLPLAVIELKNPADEHADVWRAYHQLQTYKDEIPDLFNTNAALVVSDGFTARIGSLTASEERFMPWRTIKNENDKPLLEFEMEKVIRGFFDRELFLDYLRHFILFEQDGDRISKKIAGYHQFHAVREAVRVTVIAAREEQAERVEDPRADYGRRVVPGSRKAGVVWHTQGSGKSISMVCYAGKLLQQPEMKNPTIVVVTDRNDLDGQLYETFCAADVVTQITRAFSLCGTLDEAAALKREIAFFSAIKAAIVKYTSVDRKLSEAEKHSALKRILDNAVVAEGVSDIFALAGIDKPNIGLLSEEFLDEVRNMPAKNLAVELLEKLMRDEIKAHTRTNVVQQKKFSERLLESLRKYHNRAIETAQVIEELIQMAKEFQEAMARNEALGLNSDEIAFYDALAERPEVLQTMGDDTLKKLAAELTEKLRQNTSVDWQVRESVRAKMRLLIKRLLRKYKYPPEGQDEAVSRVIEQAEALANEWSR